MRTESKNAQAQQQTSTPNPSLKRLEVLVGDWNTEMSEMSFAPDPSARVHGQVSFEWIEGGAFLMMHMGAEHSPFPSAIEIIGRDESVETYSVLYFDSRGVSRIYEMSLDNGVWKMWRNSPGFSQRFMGTFSTDVNTITARREKSNDGITWEHDFNLTYTRVK